MLISPWKSHGVRNRIAVSPAYTTLQQCELFTHFFVSMSIIRVANFSLMSLGFGARGGRGLGSLNRPNPLLIRHCRLLAQSANL